MNNVNKNSTERKGVFSRLWKLNGKTKDVLLLILLSFAIVFSVWTVFSFGEQTDTPVNVSATETEQKLARLLSCIDGVGEAEVIVCETENGVQSVVIVCDGAKNLQVVINVREAVSAALGTEQSCVKIYLKKE